MQENRQPLVNVDNAVLQPLLLEELANRAIKADILRLDKLHPIISGNKWFKLKYYLEEALQTGHTNLLSFGGAWSNHIIATAYAAHLSGLGSVGIIRGERPEKFSTTLQAAISYGMQLEFMSRADYAMKADPRFIHDLRKKYGNIYIIPEGGAGEKGVEGSREILSLAGQTAYSHVICCIGTGTMYAGLVLSCSGTQEVIGIPVLKGFQNQESKFVESFMPAKKRPNTTIFFDYHFGGYAKKTPELLRFMNDLYETTGIATDFVYTGKLFYAFLDIVKKEYFPSGSHILMVHSGGLQGNSSLPAGTLLFS